MKHLAFVAVLLMITISGLAQNDETTIDGWIEVFTETLSVEAKKTVFSTKRICEGEVKLIFVPNGKTCIINDGFVEAYVFYKEDNQVFAKKFDNCSGFRTQQLSSLQFFEFFQSNSSALLSEEVKPYKAANVNTQPQSSAKVYRCNRSFLFYGDNGSVNKSYKIYDLTTTEAQPNVYFEANNKTKVTKLDSLLDTVIANFDASSQYKRD